MKVEKGVKSREVVTHSHFKKENENVSLEKP
jgi:hypothetical protein